MLEQISIHAPAEGATVRIIEIEKRMEDFNPRSRGGSDYGDFDRLYQMIDFNPRSRGGSDSLRSSSAPVFQNFNPRSRGGSDSKCPEYTRSYLYFNPRSRGGSDSKHTQFFRSNFRTKCAYLYFLLHYIFFTQNKQSYK